MNAPFFARSISNAKKIQACLKQHVSITQFKGIVTSIAGVDASFSRNSVIGTACLFSYPDITLVENAFAVMKTPFPYVPGFLSFREGPVIIRTLKKLALTPDVLLFDGQGIAHPQGLGIASHIGVLLNLPAIGCAKSRLVGEYHEPGLQKGSRSRLRLGRKTIGAVVRTKENTKPVFVSPGHLIDLNTSIRIVLATTQGFRLPEPIRQADLLSKKIKREKDRTP